METPVPIAAPKSVNEGSAIIVSPIDTGENDFGPTPGVIYTVGTGGILIPIPQDGTIIDPVRVVIDPIGEDLLIMDTDGNQVHRFDPNTGNSSVIFSATSLPWDSWNGLKITPYGTHIFVTNDVTAENYTLSRSVPRSPNQPPVKSVDQAIVQEGKGQTAQNSGTIGDPDGDSLTLSASVGWVSDNGDGTWYWSFLTGDGPADGQTVISQVDDGNGVTAQIDFSLVVDNVAPSIKDLILPEEPVNIDDQSQEEITVSFGDPAGTIDETYSCEFDLNNDGVTDTTVFATGNQCTTQFAYDSPGVYSVAVTVYDKDGGFMHVGAADFVVLYDASGGFVTGRGRSYSEAGAYPSDSTLEGEASFGFTSRYKKGQSEPSGKTEFRLHVANLSFKSESYEWLVVVGHKAMFKGIGSINDSGDYGFLISVIDEKLTPSTASDLVRIKFWDRNTCDSVVYDNLMEADELVDPTTVISAGNIVIHGN